MGRLRPGRGGRRHRHPATSALALRPRVERHPLSAHLPLVGLAVAPGWPSASPKATGRNCPGECPVLRTGSRSFPALVPARCRMDGQERPLLLMRLQGGRPTGCPSSSFRGGPSVPVPCSSARPAGHRRVPSWPGLSLVPGVAMGIGAMATVMLKLPLTSTLLATLLLVQRRAGRGHAAGHRGGRGRLRHHRVDAADPGRALRTMTAFDHRPAPDRPVAPGARSADAAHAGVTEPVDLTRALIGPSRPGTDPDHRVHTGVERESGNVEEVPIPVTGFIIVLSSERGTRKGASYIAGWLRLWSWWLLSLVTGGHGQRPPDHRGPTTPVADCAIQRSWSSRSLSGWRSSVLVLHRHRRSDR